MTQWVHEAGGAVMQAHPFRDRFYISQIHLFPDGVDGIEGINTANTANDNLAALCYALHYHLPIIAGSDTHDKARIDDMNGGIFSETPIESEQDFAKRLVQREVFPIFYPDALFAGMECLRIQLPAEIGRDGHWEDLSHKEIYEWIRAAGADGRRPEHAVRKIVEQLQGGAHHEH